MLDDNTPTRSVAAILVKVLTVHITVAANYAFLSKVQGRKLPGRLNTIHTMFFVFTPTFLVVESIANLISSIINLASDTVEGKQTQLSFTISAVLGSHAESLHRDGDSSSSRQHIPLTELSCSQCDHTTSRIDSTWMGRIIICIFTLAQGVGTIISWIQRIMMTYQPVFGLDDRIGGMGVATTIMSCRTLLLLIMRTSYTVDQPPILLPDNSTARHGRRFITLALIATVAQEFTRVTNYRNGGLVQQSVFMKNWRLGILILSTILVIVFLYQNANLEHTVIGRLYKRRVPRTVRWRIRDCIYLGILAFVLCVLALKVVRDFVDLSASTWEQQWIQTPLSETIPVL